jgi:small subunit ribosomal protein S7
MRDGKKFLAQRIVYEAFDLVEKKTKSNPVLIFEKAVENLMPKMETKPTRVGGATYQVPYEVNEKRGRFLAMKWMLTEARKKKGKPMSEKLAEEIILASKNEGGAIKKKIDTEKMAEANKAFAHLATK